MKEIKIWQMILICIGTIFLLMIGDIIYSTFNGFTESSSVFGIGHELLSVLSATIFGITSCVLYKKYNNLLVPITVHFLNKNI